jgi:hypothetical protein
MKNTGANQTTTRKPNEFRVFKSQRKFIKMSKYNNNNNNKNLESACGHKATTILWIQGYEQIMDLVNTSQVATKNKRNNFAC